MMKIILLTLFLFCGFGNINEIPVNVFAAEEVENILEVNEKEVVGKIILVNSEKSKIVVKYVADDKEQTTQRSVFNLDEQSLIEKLSKKVNVSELIEGDKVSVRYKIGEKRKKIITSMIVEDENINREEAITSSK
ncbi:MAG: hypothetical protein KKF78_06260 [Candidatus Omnitrophica bacterium]|nr:hypothetical protein [Candidatus Omnitrophota bacterium]MBU1996739.1 hypothetical protein [Candidatus Omnitrophota bacterium]